MVTCTHIKTSWIPVTLLSDYDDDDDDNNNDDDDDDDDDDVVKVVVSVSYTSRHIFTT